MRPRSLLFVGLAVATVVGVASPNVAEAAPRQAIRKPVAGGLNMTSQGPSIAMQTAKEAQAGVLPGTRQLAGAAQPAESPTSVPDGSVAGLVVTPDTPRQGKVVASTDASSLTSPNFKVADAADKSMAIGLTNNTAAGSVAIDNRPLNGSTIGVIRNNPDLIGSLPVRNDVGVATVF